MSTPGVGAPRSSTLILVFAAIFAFVPYPLAAPSGRGPHSDRSAKQVIVTINVTADLMESLRTKPADKLEEQIPASLEFDIVALDIARNLIQSARPQDGQGGDSASGRRPSVVLTLDDVFPLLSSNRSLVARLGDLPDLVQCASPKPSTELPCSPGAFDVYFLRATVTEQEGRNAHVHGVRVDLLPASEESKDKGSIRAISTGKGYGTLPSALYDAVAKLLSKKPVRDLIGVEINNSPQRKEELLEKILDRTEEGSARSSGRELPPYLANARARMLRAAGLSQTGDREKALLTAAVDSLNSYVAIDENAADGTHSSTPSTDYIPAVIEQIRSLDRLHDLFYRHNDEVENELARAKRKLADRREAETYPEWAAKLAEWGLRNCGSCAEGSEGCVPCYVAIRQMNEVFAKDQAAADPHFRLGRFLLTRIEGLASIRRDDLNEAEGLLKDTLKLNPAALSAAIQLVRARAIAGDWETVSRLMKTAARLWEVPDPWSEASNLEVSLWQFDYLHDVEKPQKAGGSAGSTTVFDDRRGKTPRWGLVRKADEVRDATEEKIRQDTVEPDELNERADEYRSAVYGHFRYFQRVAAATAMAIGDTDTASRDVVRSLPGPAARGWASTLFGEDAGGNDHRKTLSQLLELKDEASRSKWLTDARPNHEDIAFMAMLEMNLGNIEESQRYAGVLRLRYPCIHTEAGCESKVASGSEFDSAVVVSRVLLMAGDIQGSSRAAARAATWYAWPGRRLQAEPSSLGRQGVDPPVPLESVAKQLKPVKRR